MYRQSHSYCERDSPPFCDDEKRVHFNEKDNLIHTVTSRLEFTAEEHLASFYTEEEYAAMRLRDKIIARCRGLGNGDKENEELGLESRRDRFLRKQRINECSVSVLLEQELQRTVMENDRTGIAEVLREFSVMSAKLAFRRAHENAIQVQNTYQWVCNDVNDHIEIRDRPSSPTSTADILKYDCHFQSDSNKEGLEEKATDYFAPNSYRIPPRNEMVTLPLSYSASIHNTDNTGSNTSPVSSVIHSPGPIDHFHLFPRYPWEERWIHQHSQHHNAEGPIHHTHWYLAE